jgi:hypothetical protein
LPSTTFISKFKQFVVDCTNLKHFEDDIQCKIMQKYGVILKQFSDGWDEEFCLSKPRTTEGPRTREARIREEILYCKKACRAQRFDFDKSGAYCGVLRRISGRI